MAQGPENTFIGSVHRKLLPAIYAMKNHNEYNGGIPDCWYSAAPVRKVRASRDLWIEYKFVSMPKRPDTVIDLLHHTPKTKPMLSALQQEWITERQREGRNVWVIVGSEDGGLLIRDQSWRHPFTAAEFKAELGTRADLAKIISHFCLGE